MNRPPLLTAGGKSAAARSLRDQVTWIPPGVCVVAPASAVSISRQYLGYGSAPGDLGEGTSVSMKVVKRFDPRPRRTPVVGYAILDQAEIHEYILKNFGAVKVATTKAQRKLFFNLGVDEAGPLKASGPAMLAATTAA